MCVVESQKRGQRQVGFRRYQAGLCDNDSLDVASGSEAAIDVVDEFLEVVKGIVSMMNNNGIALLEFDTVMVSVRDRLRRS
jgi:hypothetical protein